MTLLRACNIFDFGRKRYEPYEVVSEHKLASVRLSMLVSYI